MKMTRQKIEDDWLYVESHNDEDGESRNNDATATTIEMKSPWSRVKKLQKVKATRYNIQSEAD